MQQPCDTMFLYQLNISRSILLFYTDKAITKQKRTSYVDFSKFFFCWDEKVLVFKYLPMSSHKCY